MRGFLLLLATGCTSSVTGGGASAALGYIPEDADLTPGARLLEERLAGGLGAPSLAEMRSLNGVDFGDGAVPPPTAWDFTPPPTIRVWRSSLGGSSSCDGPVDIVPFEDYVPAVLGNEWISSWDDESLMAGAVAVRSYSAWWVNAGGKYDCADICDTTSCQVYDETGYASTDAAGAATEGEYAVNGTSLEYTEYSAENGDPTADGVSEPYCSGESVNGHGRGMCQWGTSRWADHGYDHCFMVEHYYPGATCAIIGVDEDGDGYDGDDCDDTNAAVHPGALEYCNGHDDNCDGVTDEPTAVDAPTWYQDADGDTFGDAAVSQPACEQPAGYVADDTDCNDANALAWPGAPELCDGVDNDCLGDIDEGYDVDADGYSTCMGDCDDADPAVNPGAVEAEDGLDNDCNWRVDDGTAVYDDDRDGWTELAGDCDDADAVQFPGAPELPNGQDDDCDGAVDEGTTASDDDLDGWTDSGGDCDDGDAAIFPGAAERANDRDDDCDGIVDEGTVNADDDADGYTGTGGDCDDADRRVNPGAAELPDGIDNDCDGVVDDGTVLGDDDGDGYSEAEGDCDDTDAAASPRATEVVDGLDNDCDGTVDDETTTSDDDHDGWTDDAGDCDDADLRAYPGAAEVQDGRDNNCDGIVDDGTVAADDDADGYTELEGDCDDGDGFTWPGAPEVQNLRDDDCDGVVDNHTREFDDDRDGWTEVDGDCDDADAYVFPGARERLDGRDDDCEVERTEGWACGVAGGSAGSSLGIALAAVLLRRRRPSRSA